MGYHQATIYADNEHSPNILRGVSFLTIGGVTSYPINDYLLDLCVLFVIRSYRTDLGHDVNVWTHCCMCALRIFVSCLATSGTIHHFRLELFCWASWHVFIHTNKYFTTVNPRAYSQAISHGWWPKIQFNNSQCPDLIQLWKTFLPDTHVCGNHV